MSKEVLNKVLKVNEIFHSIQGEGGRAGEASIFIRLSGCNLHCEFCDTKHETFTEMTIQAILDAIEKYPCSWIVWTGGEPLLQLTEEIIHIFFRNSYHQALETNGTQFIFKGFNYVTVSPKLKNWNSFKTDISYGTSNFEIRFPLKNGDMPPYMMGNYKYSYYLSPIFSENKEETENNINHCISLVKWDPRFKLSVQLQKLLNFQ
jgi:organic radical activating enzyme